MYSLTVSFFSFSSLILLSSVPLKLALNGTINNLSNAASVFSRIGGKSLALKIKSNLKTRSIYDRPFLLIVIGSPLIILFITSISSNGFEPTSSPMLQIAFSSFSKEN